MKTKLAVTFALLALVPFGLAACGGDDDDDDAATETTTTEETDTGGEEGGAGSTVSFTANPAGELAFEEDSAEATAGAVTIELTNDSAVPHDVQIEGPDGFSIGTAGMELAPSNLNDGAPAIRRGEREHLDPRVAAGPRQAERRRSSLRLHSGNRRPLGNRWQATPAGVSTASF